MNQEQLCTHAVGIYNNVGCKVASLFGIYKQVSAFVVSILLLVIFQISIFRIKQKRFLIVGLKFTLRPTTPQRYVFFL